MWLRLTVHRHVLINVDKINCTPHQHVLIDVVKINCTPTCTNRCG